MQNNKLQIIHMYRAFVRYGLRAVQYKTPQRYFYMQILRHRFETHQGTPSWTSIENTLQFVKNAAEYDCLEAKILFNLLHVEYGRTSVRWNIVKAYGNEKKKGADSLAAYNFSYGSLDEVVKNLNFTMNLCL